MTGEDDFYPALAEAELGEGQSRAVTINAWSILLARHEGAVYALVNTCSHANASLAEGRLRRGAVMCPLHGARFDLKTGASADPAYRPLKIFVTRIGDGWIEVSVPAEPPSAQYIPIPARA